MDTEEKEVRQKVRLDLWKSLFRFALEYKKEFLGLALLLIGTAMLEAASPFITGWVIDTIILGGKVKLLPAFVLVYFVYLNLDAIFVKAFIDKGGRVEMGVNFSIRRKAFEKIQELSFSYYDKTNSGWIMSRVTSDVGRLADVMAWCLIDGVWGVTRMIFSVVLLFAYEWRLALVTLSACIPIAVISILLERRLTEQSREVRALNSKLTAEFSEGIKGARTVKTLVCEENRMKQFAEKTLTMKNAAVKLKMLSASYLPLIMTLGYIGTILAIIVGSSLSTGGMISTGVLVAFIFASLQFFDPVSELARVFTEIQYAQASGERVMSLLTTKSEIVDSEAAISRIEELRSAGSRMPKLAGAIDFDHVTFEYVQNKPVLKDFSLAVQAGQKIALVGETGSGKSTIVNLACHFYEPSRGTIRIDGDDYRNIPLEHLYANLGYVLQTPYLFTGTIRENIRYGRLDATDLEVEAAAKNVFADEFIRGLEKGYDTEVGEGGTLLSVGQKQLISFARAVIADPAFLILDEATSSVDTETEKLIQKALAEVLKNRTSFIIAHRLSTIVDADAIVVLRHGVVLEQGRHAELMKAKGYYWKLFTSQFIEKAESEVLGFTLSFDEELEETSA